MMPLVDGFGRVHKDLRVSLTDHCNLRCSYCMPAEGVPWLPNDVLLTTDEIIKLVGIAVAHGVSKVRLTGGEPLLRPDILEIVAGIASLGVEMSMTTNGTRLAGLAAPLARAGLHRVNVSLDSLDPLRYALITRRNQHAVVLDGIIAAAGAGLTPVKINAVLQRGVNDDEADALMAWALNRGFEMRFIEHMPLDAGHTWNRAEMLTAAEILAALSREHDLEPIPGRGAAPAERFLVDGGPGTVGVIASVTQPFCGACDRLRLTADGQLRNCLFSRTESDLRMPLRAGASDEELAEIFRSCLAGKLPGHGIDEPGFLQPPRPMSAIGG